jgi:hypothetical protein
LCTEARIRVTKKGASASLVRAGEKLQVLVSPTLSLPPPPQPPQQPSPLVGLATSATAAATTTTTDAFAFSFGSVLPEDERQFWVMVHGSRSAAVIDREVIEAAGDWRPTATQSEWLLFEVAEHGVFRRESQTAGTRMKPSMTKVECLRLDFEDGMPLWIDTALTYDVAALLVSPPQQQQQQQSSSEQHCAHLSPIAPQFPDVLFACMAPSAEFGGSIVG